MIARHKFHIAIFLLFLLGLCGIVWGDSLPWPKFQHLAAELSVALIVAGVLALTVDLFFKREFARDVFNAAFNYIIPDELKNEIGRILEYKLICVKHNMVLKLVEIDNNLMRLEIHIQRTIKNISSNKQLINNSFAIDDWKLGPDPQITKCTMSFKDKQFNSGPRSYLGIDAIGSKTKDIKIKNGEEVTLISEGSEIKNRNSEFFINFTVPTMNPTVTVEVPKEFDYSFNFGIPGTAENKTKLRISDQYELNGTQFPGQFMRLRWWPRDTPMRPASD